MESKRSFTASLLIIALLGLLCITCSVLFEKISGILVEIGAGCLVSVISTLIFSYFILPGKKIDQDLLKAFAINLVEEIGADKYKENIRMFLNQPITANDHEFHFNKQRSLNLVKNSTLHEEVTVGENSDSKLQYFVDLMDNVLSNPAYLHSLVNDMCYLINTTCREKKIQYDKIITHKMGNPSMALLTAHKLGKPCLFYTGHDPYTSGILLTEGNLHRRDRVIVIHDVLATLSRMESLVNYVLEEKQAKIEHIFTFIERTDSCLKRENVRSYFTQKGIKLHSLHKLNDKNLSELLQKD